jgi:hypothetical protein
VDDGGRGNLVNLGCDRRRVPYVRLGGDRLVTEPGEKVSAHEPGRARNEDHASLLTSDQ